MENAPFLISNLLKAIIQQQGRYMTNHIQEMADSPVTNIWPDFFPNGAPPEGAIPPSGDFFRITNKPKPTKKCLASDFEKDPDILDMRTGLQVVCSYGVSLQNTIEGARATVGRFKNATRKRYIAKATLNENVGRVMQTFKEDYHHTLWSFQGVETHTYFSCFEVVEPK
ncbi:hypothetical protein [Kluyvera intermedia]|uniref:Bacteriophage protein n=1 Tax=Kluyvera intermedia TaxID=61648 RepID=A0ABX6DPY6_KLUIN|nr:hypothetical protein [Kluyvera intermedia]QGH30463.1 hypothetical protein GHC21_12620 [Kluyvera intermedia]QGH39445.1 hypothetical protein GHC38_12620 [Kluyvera intermedia]